jgi:3',5'-cyclic-nucleotide phosphodiesterase
MEEFQIVVLGCTGGPRENNLSGYLLSPLEKQEWIALDAGSLLTGIDRAIEKNNLREITFTHSALTSPGEMLIKHLRAYLISHTHLDHIAGLVLNSPIDEPKYILGIDPTIDNLRDYIFNGRIWPNFGSEGVEPILGLYEYIRLPLSTQREIPNTSMRVEAFLLSHPNGYPSSAFLIEYRGHYLLYFGDTSSDQLEKKKNLAQIWHRITPLLKKGKIQGMLLECSDPQHLAAERVMFGHLNTKLMIEELHHLSEIADHSLEGFKVVVTHRKESLEKEIDTFALIEEELLAMNDLGIHFLFPSQGDRLLL